MSEGVHPSFEKNNYDAVGAEMKTKQKKKDGTGAADPEAEVAE